jgi:hypothetical protein
MLSSEVVAERSPSAHPAGVPNAELLFAGQYVLGPRGAISRPGWMHYSLPHGFTLSAHPLLPVSQVAGESRALTLIGYVLDATDPHADDASILTRLLESCASVHTLIESSANLGGRWLLAAACDDGFYLLTDALGLRQALYYAPTDGRGVWAMSQAGLAIDLLGLAVDEQAKQFLDSYVVRARRPEYYWPGMRTPVCGVRHLLPNHVLNLVTGQMTRYWPGGKLPELSLSEAVERVTTLIPNLVRAAAARFDLALSITAGVDSRLVLAAARSVSDRVACVTLRQARMADNSEDLVIPTRLLGRLGLVHEVVRAPGGMSADFSWLFKRSVFQAHDHYGPDAEALLGRFGRRKVALTGSGAEVGRCAFRAQFPFSDLRRITAADLAWLEGMRHPYAIECFQEWLEDVGDGGAVKLLDLFEWEQGQGNWLAMTQLEFDIAWRDIFTPYNCRSVLTTMLSVDEKFRRAPGYKLFASATEKLWKDVLSEPINPSKRSNPLRRWIRGVRQGLRSLCVRPLLLVYGVWHVAERLPGAAWYVVV